MNVYFCDAGAHDVCEEHIDYWPRYESYFINDVVFAATPGQAKVRFMAARSGECRDGIEFTDIRVRKLGTEPRREVPGFAKSTSSWWARVVHV